MRLVFSIIVLLIVAIDSLGQLPKKIMEQMGPFPVFFIDSNEVEVGSLTALNPMDISNIGILKPKKAKRRLGEKGADGAVYVTTVKCAKRVYWNFFRTKSESYKQLLDSPEADSVVQYILNGNPLSSSAAPGELFLVANKNFRHIDIVEKEKLASANLLSKRYIVLITSKRPKGVVKNSSSK